MNEFSYPVHLRWADMDPNFHLRHDVYYGIGAQARIAVLAKLGITNQRMQEVHIAPILFREECLFKREVRLGQQVEMRVWLSEARADGARWSFHHELLRDDGTLCAEINVDGAWTDTQLRKLAVPPQEFVADFLKLPRTAQFEMLPFPPAK